MKHLFVGITAYILLILLIGKLGLFLECILDLLSIVPIFVIGSGYNPKTTFTTIKAEEETAVRVSTETHVVFVYDSTLCGSRSIVSKFAKNLQLGIFFIDM